MSKLSFRGGVHPDDGKKLTKDKAVRELTPKLPLIYPLSQHIGAPAKALVNKGDRVLVGMKIAEAGGFVSAPIYSSVSGTVKSIEKHLVATGDQVESIIIENDDAYEEAPRMQELDYLETSAEDLLKRISEAGVVGMGGAGFPTHVKLSPKNPDKIDYIIVNGAECEPYLTSDYRRMMEEGEKVILGLKILLKMFPNARGIIAIEDNKDDCVRYMKRLSKDNPRIVVKELHTKYPQGAERQLIYATTRRTMNSSMLPADVGCIVDNVDTVHAICEAVTEGKPLMERIVTVTGDAIRSPHNYRVRIGTNMQDLIAEAGGLRTQCEKIVSGGPMMGFAMFSTDVPVTKNTSAILCLARDDVSRYPETACIKCGKCVEVCPGRVMPNELATAARRGDKEAFLAHEGMECCECGCCSYICPAKRQLTQAIKSMRKTILEDRKKK